MTCAPSIARRESNLAVLVECERISCKQRGQSRMRNGQVPNIEVRDGVRYVRGSCAPVDVRIVSR